jgi:hypothetical protein
MFSGSRRFKAIFMKTKLRRSKIRLAQRQGLKMSTRQRIILGSSIAAFLVTGLIIVFNFTNNEKTMAATLGDYRSKATGSWTNASSWQKYNGTSWVDASAAPTTADGAINILSGHTITISSNVTADNLTVDAGGTLQITSNTLTVANGTGTDIIIDGTLIITKDLNFNSNANMDVNGLVTLKSTGGINFNSGCLINVDGNFRREGGSVSLTSTYWSINNGGTYTHALNGGSLVPSASLKTGSTCEITGITTTMPTNINQIFYNLTWNCPGQLAGIDLSARLDFVNGDLTVASTGSGSLQLDYQGNNNLLNIGGDLTISGGITYGCANGSAIINIGGDYNHSGGSFNFNKAGVTAYGNTSTSLNISGNLNVTGGTIDVTQSTANNPAIGIGTINLQGNLSVTGGQITETSPDARGQIHFAGTAIQTYDLNNLVNNTIDFIVDDSAIVRTNLKNITSSGDFILSDGGHLMIGSPDGITKTTQLGNIRVTGTRTYSTNADYTYEGASAQVTGNGLTGARNLTVNNSSNVTLSATVPVSNILTFTSGKIITNSYEVSVTNTATTSITGHSTSNYVIGNLRRYILNTGAYEFPLGTAANAELATITFSGVSGFSNILGTFTQSLPIASLLPLLGVLCNSVPVIDMLNYGYWEFTPNSPMSGGSYTMTLNEKGATNLSGPSQTYCVLKRPNILSSWASLGTHNNNTQVVASNVVTAVRSGLSGFSHFGIGKTSAGTLPIKLTAFNAKLSNGAVNLDWITAGEVNNNFFTIERSSDGENFEALMQKNGAGNSTVNRYYTATDESPLEGFSYYRLKQTDYDGHYTYSDIETIRNGKEMEPSHSMEIKTMAPNPFTQSFKLSYISKSETTVDISLMSMSGQLVIQEKVKAEAGYNTWEFKDQYSLQSGIYFVTLAYNNKKVIGKILKN